MKKPTNLVIALLCTFAVVANLSAQEKVSPPWTFEIAKTAFEIKAGGAPWELDLEFPTTKMYTLSLSIKPALAAGSGEILVDGFAVEKFKFVQGATSIELPPIFFDEGAIPVGVQINKGNIQLMALSIRDSLKIHTGAPLSVPVNPDASPEAKRLMAYLAAQYGKSIISGQQDLTWNDSVDMVAKVKSQTGKEPALLGFDFLNYLGAADGANGLRQVEEAIAWHKRGGIVAFCWHWRVGSAKEFYTQKTDFRINTKPDSKEWQALIRDIDALAPHLKKLADAGVPVLWRPLHEASGGWFWWGASGPKNFIAVWNLMYERLTKVHKINNLLWVWNGQHGDWYPGDATVDIVGMDIYGGDKMYNSWKDSWVMAQGMVTGDTARMVALTENSVFPDPDNLIADKVPWSWFMTWNDGDKGKPEDDFFSGFKYMDLAHKVKTFNHDYVITLDELPKW